MRRSLLALLFIAAPLLPACVTDRADDVTVQALNNSGGTSDGGCSRSTCHGVDRTGGAGLVAPDDDADLAAPASCGNSPSCHGVVTSDTAPNGTGFFVAGSGELDDCPHLELHDTLLADYVTGANSGTCQTCHVSSDPN